MCSCNGSRPDTCSSSYLLGLYLGDGHVHVASNPRNISVSHRRSVAILDGLIGPKA
jgi:hypothetical protein